MQMQLTSRDSSAASGVPGPSSDFEDFIYLISHDVRNSVRALIEVPQWIAEDLVEAGHRIEGSLAENIGLLNSHTRRLDRMLNDLLIHSRIGRMQEVQPNDLAAAVAIMLTQVRIPKGFRVTLDLREPELRLGAIDLSTLLTALFSNSVRHRDRDFGSIVFASRRDGSEVVLTYSDDGPGIEKPLRQRAMGAMTTLKSRDEVEGSGMGLAHLGKIVGFYDGRFDWLDLPGPRGLAIDLRFPV